MIRPSRRLLTVSLLVCASTLCAQPVEHPAVDLHRAQQAVFRAAADHVAPCIVTIETIGGTQPPSGPLPTTQAAGNRPRRPTGGGFIVAEGPTTGIIHSADGLILTSSFNFIRDPSLITVTLHDGRRFLAELLARDEVRKLAMLRIKADNLPVPQWVTDSTTLRTGQWTIALGQGFGGDEPMVSVGIISALNRQSGLAVQTDAKLSPANYGGPLINIDGRIIGVCVPMGLGMGEMAGVELYDSGLGFAIPFDQVERSARELADGHSLRRGLLGVAINDRISDKIVIAGVADPSPAIRAGLATGDRITAIDDKPVQTYIDLRRVMAARLAGQRVRMSIERGDEQKVVELVLSVPEDLGRISKPDEEGEDK